MRLSFVLCFVVSAASVAGCVVGEQTPGPGGGDPLEVGPDAGEDPGPGGEPLVCEEPAATLPNGNHNAGLACRSCHNGSTVGAPTWTIAGTLYDSKAGTAPVAGATILVRDANGVERKLITASNGNFYTAEAVAFPVTVAASKCPDTKAMTGTPGDGDCNNCHTANSSQGRIHLP